MAQRSGLLLPGEPRPRRAGRRRVSAGALPRQSRRGGRDTTALRDARQKAEEALAVFDQLGAQSAKAEAYRVIGMVYRETGRIVLAESRLRSAIELAATAGAVLGEAEASRELALLYQAMARTRKRSGCSTPPPGCSSGWTPGGPDSRGWEAGRTQGGVPGGGTRLGSINRIERQLRVWPL